MDIENQIAEEMEIKVWQVQAVVKLIDEGNTIPFIARYRKEMHGSLDDTTLRNLNDRLTYLRNLQAKKEQVIASIEEQGCMTKALHLSIMNAVTQVEVDDLYRPFRPKRKTRAVIAREKGLETLADIIKLQMADTDIMNIASDYISDEKGVASAEEALSGAGDIIAEEISDNADYRMAIRDMTRREGLIISAAKDSEAKSVYENYYDFSEPVKKISGYRILAINRGEKEKYLTVKVEAPYESIIRYLERNVIVKDNTYTVPFLKKTIADSYERLIAPSVERDIRNELTENAEEGAVAVFGKNLTQLLMQPPIAGKTVLGWDPAFRTGCKLAVVDATGKVLDTTVVYPTMPQNKGAETKRIVDALIKRYDINLISIGNGTASRESEKIVADILKDHPNVKYVIVNEAGASVYSASKLASEEFPEFDVGQRSAASIARRIQDPLSELVKIDPKSIGVGQYQHDMNQKKLGEVLTSVVEDCVNKVGVDLNTASAPLLSYIAGITKTAAKNIILYREENGKFTDGKQLKKVPKIGPKAYEQCAGFLRINDGYNPLDATSVHPESYDACKKLIDILGFNIRDIKGGIPNIKSHIKDKKALAEKVGIGEETLSDIISELEKPGRDPRLDMPKPILRTDVLEMSHLKEGMILTGTVRNVIDFGAFVDIGVHQDGLVHISQLTDKKYVKHPLEVVSVGDIVEVRVLSVDVDRKRIQLSMV